jgi:hypothetical protein
MVEVFKPGDKVIAYYDVQGSIWRGWYNAVVIRLNQDGDYVVRWEQNSGRGDKPPTSVVNEDEIKHRPSRGQYSGF